MDLKHNINVGGVVYPQHQGYVESPQHVQRQQPVNLPYPPQQSYNTQPVVGHLYGQTEQLVNLQPSSPYTAPIQHQSERVGGLRRHDDILSEASTYGSESGSEADTESDTVSVTESVTDSKTLGEVYDEMKEAAERFFYLQDIADEKVEDYEKYDKETKKQAQRSCAVLKMTLIEGYDGIDDCEDDEEDEEEQEDDNRQEQNNGLEQEDETAGGCSCKTFSYLNSISNFEDKLEGADLKRYERYQEEVAEQIIEDRDIDDDDESDSEDESNSEEEIDNESEDTQVKKDLEKKERDLKKMKAGFKKEGKYYFDHCSNGQIDTLSNLCHFTVSNCSKNDKLKSKIKPKWSPIRKSVYALADKDLSRQRKRKILLRENVGKGVLNGLLSSVLPLIQAAICK